MFVCHWSEARLHTLTCGNSKSLRFDEQMELDEELNGKRGEDEQRWRMGRRILKINTLKEENI